MSEPDLSIGELGRRTHCKVQTIRWYEEVGLLPPPARTRGGHRVYGGRHLARLDFIRHARELGFPLDAVRALWSAGERRRALALLYRASVAEMAQRAGVTLVGGGRVLLARFLGDTPEAVRRDLDGYLEASLKQGL